MKHVAWSLFCLTVVCLTVGVRSLAAQDEAPVNRQVASLEDLVAILDSDKIQHQANLEQQYLMVPINRNGLNSAQVIRWAAQDGVAHFIQVIPMQIPQEHQTAVMEAMVHLNHSFPIPGLGMNPENNTPYFRLSVPIQPRGFLLENEVKDYFNFCVNQAIQFTPTIVEVANGKLAPGAALEHHRQRLQAALGPIGSWKKQYADSEWVLVINPQGEVTLYRDGDVVVDSMVTVEEGNRMIFDDITGQLAVDGKGSYEFKVEGNTMTFTPIEDPGEGRKKVLSEGAWTRS